MSEMTFAFMSQPVYAIATEGESFAAEVIETLRRWSSEHSDQTIRARRGGMYILSSSPDSAWSVLVAHTVEGERADVCVVLFSPDDADIDMYASWIDVDHIWPVMEVASNKVAPKMFPAVAIALGGNACFPGRRWRPSGDFLEKSLASAHRWSHGRALTQTTELIENAYKEPQILAGKDDDLVMLSGHFLREAIDPTGARALALMFRNNPLSADGLGEPLVQTIAHLDELPVLGVT